MSDQPLSSSKYRPLYDHLVHLPVHVTRVVLTFEEIEAIIQDKLPPSAHDYVQFWENDRTRHHAQAWLAAGWKTTETTENWSKRRMVFMRK